jgi:hypothetical protein
VLDSSLSRGRNATTKTRRLEDGTKKTLRVHSTCVVSADRFRRASRRASNPIDTHCCRFLRDFVFFVLFVVINDGTIIVSGQ